MTTILTINRKKFFQVVSPQFLENLGVFYLYLFIFFFLSQAVLVKFRW